MKETLIAANGLGLAGPQVGMMRRLFICLDDRDPVSYTHLDVYKRQVLVDGEKVTDPKAALTVEALNKGVVIKKGKKVYHKVTL